MKVVKITKKHGGTRYHVLMEMSTDEFNKFKERTGDTMVKPTTIPMLSKEEMDDLVKGRMILTSPVIISTPSTGTYADLSNTYTTSDTRAV